MASEYILVFVTTSSSHEAEKLGKAIVEKKLAACGNIIPKIRSVFWWKETLEAEEEALLILKSRSALFSELITVIKSLHSYEVPEIIGIPIIAGSEEYLRWIDEETQHIPD